MDKLANTGTQLKCSFGTVPSNLVAPPSNRVTASEQPAATVIDYIPTSNIPPFGLCTSPSNPAVYSSGPQPCVPLTTSPWSPGSKKVTMSGKSALDSNSRCMCNWAGVITVLNPGQQKVDVQ